MESFTTLFLKAKKQLLSGKLIQQLYYCITFRRNKQQIQNNNEFNWAIKIDTLEKEKLKKIYKFKPKIAGEFSWINDHILQFSPANPLENNTTIILLH